MTPQTLTADWLRKPRGINALLTFPADCGAMLAEALDIADSCARSDLECNVPPVAGTERWYDLGGLTGDEDRRWADQAVRYLEMRGQLVRRPGEPQHVRHVEHAPAAVA